MFDLEFGDGIIDSVNVGMVTATVGKMRQFIYNSNGAKWPTDGRPDVRPTLYWSKPEISDPPPPKRMKKIIGWVNIYKYPKEYRSSEKIYGCESDATTSAAVATVPIEFEVEEAD